MEIALQYRGMKDVLDFFTSRERRFKFFDNRHMLDWMDDERYLKLAFRAKMGYPLNLKNPRTFSEKLQWLKLHDRKPLYTTLVDKYAVRQYIAGKIGEEHLIPLLGGPWKTAEEIDFDALPEQFVLKCNHDSGGVIVCRDKAGVNRDRIRARLSEGLRANYYIQGREWPYKDVKPRIVAEKFLGADLTDYRVYNFNGVPKLIYVYTNTQHGTYEKPEPDHCYIFDTEWELMPVSQASRPGAEKPERPALLGEMLELAKTLSAGLSFVRTDFYIVDDRLYNGEMTFFPGSGMSPFHPREWDYTIGSWLELPERYEI